jgi:hypothetical protein
MRDDGAARLAASRAEERRGADVTRPSGSSGSSIRIFAKDAERRELDKKLSCLDRDALR